MARPATRCRRSSTVNKVSSSTSLSSSANPSLVGCECDVYGHGDGAAPTGTRRVHGWRHCDLRLQRGGTARRHGQCEGRDLQHQQPELGHAQHRRHLCGRCRQQRLGQRDLAQVVNNVGATSTSPWPPGGVATASSTYARRYSFAASSVNNDERAGLNWGHGGGWNDATANTYPDWVQITFNGAKTIDHVVVYTLQDNYASPVEPTDTHDLLPVRRHRLHRPGLERRRLGHPRHRHRQQPGQAHRQLHRRSPPTASASTSPPPSPATPASPKSKPGAPAPDHRRKATSPSLPTVVSLRPPAPTPPPATPLPSAASTTANAPASTGAMAVAGTTVPPTAIRTGSRSSSTAPRPSITSSSIPSRTTTPVRSSPPTP